MSEHNGAGTESGNSELNSFIENVFGENAPTLGIVIVCFFIGFEASLGLLSNTLFLIGTVSTGAVSSLSTIGIIIAIVLIHAAGVISVIGMWKQKSWGWYSGVFVVVLFAVVRLGQFPNVTIGDGIMLLGYGCSILYLYRSRSEFASLNSNRTI